MNTEDVVGAAKIGETTKTGETITTAHGDRPHGPHFSAASSGTDEFRKELCHVVGLTLPSLHLLLFGMSFEVLYSPTLPV